MCVVLCLHVVTIGYVCVYWASVHTLTCSLLRVSEHVLWQVHSLWVWVDYPS